MKKQLLQSNVLPYLKSGHATVTIQSEKTGNHFTYKFVVPKKDRNTPNYDGPVWVQQLNGGEDRNYYTYIGFMVKNSKFVPSNGVNSKAVGSLSVAWLIRNLSKLTGNVKVYHSGRCGRCGKKLTTPKSIEYGIGPRCRGFK